MTDVTPFFLEPQVKNIDKRVPPPVYLGDYAHGRRMVSRCSHPDCAEYDLYRDTPLCRAHAAEVWKLFEEREPAVHKDIVREEYKAEQVRKKAEIEASTNRRRISSYRPGYVYYLQVGDRIKIGYTAILENRMKAYPPNSVLLASHPGTKAVERDMHLRFAMYLKEGREWFSVSQTLLNHIEDVKARYPKHGQDDDPNHPFIRPTRQQLIDAGAI